LTIFSLNDSLFTIFCSVTMLALLYPPRVALNAT